MPAKLAKASVMRGFALMEIMIAIAVIGLALPALMLRIEGIARTQSFIEERTMAYWVAENKLQEMFAEQRLGRAITRTRRDADTVEYGGREWRWRYEIKERPDLTQTLQLTTSKIYQVDLEVGLGKDDVLASLEAIVSE